MPFHWDGWVAFLIPYIVWLVAEPLPLERAEADARQVASSPGMRRGDAVNVSAGLGLIAVMRGDDKAARKHYGELEPFSGMVVCPYYGVTADHLLGLLAQAMDDLPAACGHFDAALAFCRSSGLLLELAYTCRDYARLLAAGTSREDWDRASAFCREAERIAQSAGLVPLLRTLRELRKTLEEKTRGVRAGEPSPGPRGPEAGGAPGSLSRRELDVLRLLTGGLSNEQIGDRLFISPHTVANHVQRILEKTGTSNRTDAAVFAVRHGLALPGITS
jgi:DNA-binding CsgD family transcriptional regulator